MRVLGVDLAESNLVYLATGHCGCSMGVVGKVGISHTIVYSYG